MVKDGAFSHKIDFVTIFWEKLNIEGLNSITGSKVTAILLNGGILRIGESSAVKGLRLQPAQQACLYLAKHPWAFSWLEVKWSVTVY